MLAHPALKGLRFIDFFAGAGGQTIGAEMAGMEPVLCANHWNRSVTTHGTNYPAVEHLIGDLSVLDPKLLPKGYFDVLVCSPECTMFSGARNYREAVREMRPWDPKRGIERSRCTMWCPQRWAAYHRPLFVLCENVVDVSRWNQFAAWCDEWDTLGYHLHAYSLNAAFAGAPQSRDRIYLVATRKDLGLVEPLQFPAPCHCFSCETTVMGIQTWKPAAIRRAQRTGNPVGPVGKYGASWVFTCPTCQDTVSPYTLPAVYGIDWSIQAVKIGEREQHGLRPLQSSTMDRAERGRRQLGVIPQLVPLDHPGQSKGTRPMWLPYATQTGRQDVAMMLPPGMQVDLRGTNQPRPLFSPLSTLAAADGGFQHAFLMANMANNVPGGVDEPVGAVTTGNRHYLVSSAGGPMVVQVGGNLFERDGYARAWHGDQPLKAVTCQGDRAITAAPGVGEAMIAACYGGPNGGHERDVTQSPMGALTAGGSASVPPQAIIRAPQGVLASYYGTGGERSTDTPAGALTGKDRHALMQPPALLVRSGGTRQRDCLDASVAPHPTRMPTDSYAIAAGQCDPSDIPLEEWTFRMISPKETQRFQRLEAKADGTPYVITGSNADQVRQNGNAVVPHQVALIHHAIGDQLAT